MGQMKNRVCVESRDSQHVLVDMYCYCRLDNYRRAGRICWHPAHGGRTVCHSGEGPRAAGYSRGVN